MFDNQRTGRPLEITDDAVAWIINIACQRPADLGYSQELWTLKNLHQHLQSHAEEAGFPRLKTITKPMVQKILKRNESKPFKIKYCCEKRDPEFETKMHDVLVVSKQISMQFDADGNIIIPDDGPMVHTIRVKSKEELAQRIYLYFEKVNREPVVYHWKYRLDEISEDEAKAI